jgi:hypothetical protein
MADLRSAQAPATWNKHLYIIGVRSLRLPIFVTLRHNRWLRPPREIRRYGALPVCADSVWEAFRVGDSAPAHACSGHRLGAECAPAVANDAIARLRPHSARSVREPLRAAGYGEKAAMYVIGERDAILPRRRGRRGSGTRAGHDHFPGLGPPLHAQPPCRASSHIGQNRRADRPRRTGHVLIRRFVLTGRAGAVAHGQARYVADLQGVGDSWNGAGGGHCRGSQGQGLAL